MTVVTAHMLVERQIICPRPDQPPEQVILSVQITADIYGHGAKGRVEDIEATAIDNLPITLTPEELTEADRILRGLSEGTALAPKHD
jgi:hypothetical protein